MAFRNPLTSLDASQITGQITAPQIANGAVIGGKLGPSAVDVANIANSAVTANAIAIDAVTAAAIAAGSVNTAELAALGITSGKLAANAVIAGKISANAVVAGNIATGAVTAGTIATGAVTAGTVAALSITAAELAANAVIAGKISANAVVAGNIATGAVTAGTVAALSITAAELAANAITADKITAGAITADKIDANALTGKILRTSATGNRVEISSATRGTQTVGEARFYTEVATDTNGGITAYGPADGTLRSLNGTAPAATGIVAPFWKLGYEDTSGSRFDVSADTTYVSKFRALGVASFAGNVDVTGTLTAGNIQKGTASVTSSPGVWVAANVTFPIAFATIPVVTVDLQGQPGATGSTTTVMTSASAISTTGFTINYFRSNGPLATTIGWIAIA